MRASSFLNGPRKGLVKLSPFLFSFAITSTFFINFCAWIFQCGCRSLWAGADMACNIHVAHSRHCPWCSNGYAGYATVMVLLCAPQLAATLFTRWNWPIRTVLAIAMFPISGLLIAFVYGRMGGYWSP
jgi:hypothetical protein